ncbi:tannase/feruloyl esterase family alpha/beta hydrolase [Sphingomonas sp. 10B4]|nr:tannase/feruloyl esterase family alpha/beta hydrolase [Sphingomonas sp. 10B4]
MTARLIAPGRVAAAALLVVLAAALAIVTGPANGRTARETRAIAGTTPPVLAIVLPATNCADLARVDLAAIGGAGSKISSAVEGTGAQPGTVCIVEGTLAPTIEFRVELPVRGWTQRYLQTGCGGLCGNLRIDVGAADGCPIVQATGFVVASTDMGHSGMSAEWTRDPQKAADFAYRGVDLTAVAAKALIRAYYGRSQRFSYFSGCSDGGREGLIEAQRFPQEFDGIVAGAPAMNFQVQNSLYHGWQARSNTGTDTKPILVAGRLAILHRAVLAACDRLDGQQDGLISAPGQCHFDPATTVCRAGQDTTDCLTAAEAAVARKFYDGPHDPGSGVRLTQGGPQYGSELAWADVYVPQSTNQPIFSSMIVNSSSGLIFPGGTLATADTLTFDQATFDRLRKRHPLFDATNPDLSGFEARGGKLILFHGWSDPHISPINTIAYHEAVRRRMRGKADGFERLYLMPGMYHCSGGEGPAEFDLLSAVIAWVETGRAPNAIQTRTQPAGQRSKFGLAANTRASKPGTNKDKTPSAAIITDSGPAIVQRSRPVYPYPYVAAYIGSGDANMASNWIRGKALPVEVPAWAGADFYKPYAGVIR